MSQPPTSLAVALAGTTARPPAAALAERIRMVLETPAGRLPWRPEFGVDLEWLVGQPLSAANLRTATDAVRDAIAAALPDLEIQDLRLLVIPERTDHTPARERAIPIAEAALLPYGAGARLDLVLDVVASGRELVIGLPIPART